MPAVSHISYCLLRIRKGGTTDAANDPRLARRRPGLNLLRDSAYRMARLDKLPIPVYRVDHKPVCVKADLDRLLATDAPTSPPALTGITPTADRVAAPVDLDRSATYVDRDIEATADRLAHLRWRRHTLDRDQPAVRRTS